MRLHVPLLLLVSLAAAASASGQELAVIVHADRDERLSLEDVSRIYLKQKRFWGERPGD